MSGFQTQWTINRRQVGLAQDLKRHAVERLSRWDDDTVARFDQAELPPGMGKAIVIGVLTDYLGTIIVAAGAEAPVLARLAEVIEVTQKMLQEMQERGTVAE